MNKSYIFIWLALMVMVFLTTACNRVYDDLSSCLSNVLVFSYLADDNQEHLQEYVDGIDVFIFDAKEDILVEKHHLEREQLLSPLEVRLPEGDYKVIALGNALKETTISKESSYRGSLVSRPELTEKDGRAASTFDRLYLGEASITSKIMNESRDVVRLNSQHVKIHAVVLSDGDNIHSWFEQNREKGFRLTMESLSARFSFSGQRGGETSFALPFVTDEKSNCFSLDFNTLRFDNDDPIKIRLMQGEKILCTVDVAQYIAQYPELIRITGRQEAVLPLFFRQNPLSLSISVKPWEAVDVVPITD